MVYKKIIYFDVQVDKEVCFCKPFLLNELKKNAYHTARDTQNLALNFAYYQNHRNYIDLSTSSDILLTSTTIYIPNMIKLQQ